MSGTALPGATVVAKAGRQADSPGCNGVANGAGYWMCDLTGLAPNTDYIITASQHGRVGGGDGWSWSDTVLAQQPLRVDALPLSFLYPPNGGHIDGDVTTFTSIFGTGTPGGQITIVSDYSATKPVYAQINAQGYWRTDSVFRFPPPSPHSEGYSVPVSQQVNGQAAPGATLRFDSWPSLKFTYPLDQTTLPSNQTSVAIKGTGLVAATVTPDLPIYPDNGAKVCDPVQIDSTGTWSCPVSNLTPAFYTLNMHQGISGQTDRPVSVHFSVARPVSIDEPIDEQAFPPQTTQVAFKGWGQPGATLKVSVPNATPCQNQVIPNSGQWACLVTGLKVGASYIATVTEGDSSAIAGGPGWLDPAVTRQFSVSGFDPLSITVPAENQVFSSTTTGITATGQAQAGAQLSINVPGAQPCQPQQAPASWQCAVSGLQPATSYLLTATQSVGGVDDAPKHADFSVATPLVVLLPKENQQLGAADTTVDISGTGQPNANVAITANPAQPCNTTADDKGRWRCMVTGLTTGTSYTAQVTQSGQGWQDPAVPRDFSVPAAQGIGIRAPRDKSVVSSNNPIDGIQIAGTGQSGAVAQVVVGSDSPRNIDIVNGAWATDPIPLSHYGVNGAPLSIVATEYVDNKPQSQATANITVAKVATVTSPRDEEEVQDIGKVTVRGQGQEGARITVNIIDGAGPKKGCGATVTQGAWSCVLTGILPGSPYTLSVLQSGQAGDWTDQPVGRVFHTRAARPIVYGHPAPGDGLPANTPYDVTGTGEPDAQLSLKLMGVIDLGFTTVQGDGTWAFTNLLSSGPGCYSLTATQMLDGYPLDQGTTQYPVGGATCPGGSPFYITEPMPDQVVVGSSYIVQGYGTPGYTVTFPNGPSCQTLVQRDGTWTCGPYPITAAGTYSVLARQTQNPSMVSGDPPTSTRRFSVLNPVAISSPADGSKTYWQANKPPPPFSVSGTATPDTWVEVSQTGGGSGDPQMVRASSAGTWSTAAVFQTPAPYPGGNCSIHACISPPLTLHVQQIYAGEVADEASVTINGEWDITQAEQGATQDQKQGSRQPVSPQGAGQGSAR
ncbi:hypothetical protein [Bordetella genomosp. 11]|nr:hypothetical protein [Bordetella genomosp. 11]